MALRRSLTVKNKLRILGLAVSTMLAVLFAVGWWGQSAIRQRAAVVTTLQNQAATLQRLLRGLAEQAIMTDTPEPPATINAATGDFTRNLEGLGHRLSAPEAKAVLHDSIAPGWEALRKGVTSYLAMEDVNPDNVAAMILYGRLAATCEKLLQQVEALAQGEQQGAEVAAGQITAAIGGLGLAIIASTILLLVSIYHSVGRPIATIADLARRTAGGDLTCDLALQRNDEIGLLALSFAEMSQGLRTMLLQVGVVTRKISTVSATMSQTSNLVLATVERQQGAIEQAVGAAGGVTHSVGAITERSETLSATAETAAAAVAQLGTTIANVAARAEDYNRIAEAAATSAATMSGSVAGVADGVQVLAVSCEKMVVAINQVAGVMQAIQEQSDQSARLAQQVSAVASEEGIAAVAAAVGGMQQIRHKVGALSRGINRLGARSDEVDRIVGVIEDVAAQTALLSLNASILAAQAGQHGRAFEVVANQIKGLANKTAASTREIAEVIAAVKDETSTSVQLAQEGLAAVETGMALTQGVNQAFQTIVGRAQASAAVSGEIKLATGQQVAVMRQLSDSVQTMNTQVNRISRATQEQRKESRIILETVEKTKLVSQQVSVSLRQQVAGNQQLAAVSEEVAGQAGQIRQILLQHRAQSQELGSSIHSIEQSSNALIQAVQGMEHATQSLEQDAGLLRIEMNKFTV